MHFESNGPEIWFGELSAGEIDSTSQVLIFLYSLKDKDDKHLFFEVFRQQIIQYNKKPPVNKQRKQKKNIIKLFMYLLKGMKK